MKLVTEKMVYGGDCIGHIDGKTIFVPYAIPGETLDVEITKDIRDYSVAQIKNIIEPSEHRTMPFCPYYQKCGGCNMQHITTDWQRKLKADILKDAFEREGVEIPEIQIIAGEDKGYRTRVQFHDGGLMGKRSNEIVPIDCCPCAVPEINHFLKEVPINERPLGRVHIFGSSAITSVPEGYDKLVIAEESEWIEKKKQKTMPRFTPNGRKLKKQKQIKARYEGTSSDTTNACTLSVLGKEISFDVQGFFQSNLEVLEKTVPLIMKGLKGKNVLDMYSGVGTFSKFLADTFEKVTLVEHNKNAIVYAEQNMAGTKHQSYGLSGDVWTKYHAETIIKADGEFDAVVIDPPRSGMEKSVCQWLQKSNIPQIRSLSCDIATHARDIKFLVRSGYALKKLYLLDFYPQTGHIESLAILEK